MSKHKPHRAERTTKKPSDSRHISLPLIGLLSLAALATVAVVMLARPGTDATASTAARVKGSPDAPVTIVEWGDFQ